MLREQQRGLWGGIAREGRVGGGRGVGYGGDLGRVDAVEHAEAWRDGGLLAVDTARVVAGVAGAADFTFAAAGALGGGLAEANGRETGRMRGRALRRLGCGGGWTGGCWRARGAGER